MSVGSKYRFYIPQELAYGQVHQQNWSRLIPFLYLKLNY
jgi:FKBP-type peptidyl-prolyl cis-trans isomerase